MSTQIYAVLIALTQDVMLLPNAAVADVVSQDLIIAPAPGEPEWLVGHCEFGGRRLPVICFEMLNGAERPAANRRSRVVVLNALGTQADVGDFALLTQGYPHLVTLNRNALLPLPLRDSDHGNILLARVRVASQEAVIPDLEALELMLAHVQAMHADEGRALV